MDGRVSGARPACRRAFTLVELLVVVGLVALVISLFMPLLSKVRASAETATCLSRLRHMSAAWLMHVAEERGRLPDFIWVSKGTPNLAWQGYWPGLLDRQSVRGDSLLCPAACEPVGPGRDGFGDAFHAWTGRFGKSGSPIRLDGETYRSSSYGYNALLTGSNSGYGADNRALFLSDLRNTAEVPVFMDCAYADLRPLNYAESSPALPPPNLRGDSVVATSPEHWRILIRRHHRGINVSMADGSAQWVRLEELYLLRWKDDWNRYRLRLPAD